MCHNCYRFVNFDFVNLFSKSYITFALLIYSFFITDIYLFVNLIEFEDKLKHKLKHKLKPYQGLKTVCL